MKLLEVVPADNNKHKYVAIFEDENLRLKRVPFGALGYNDYILYSAYDPDNAEKHKERYLNRHKKDLRTGDPTRAGFLSYYLLWNKPSLNSSLRDYRRRFNL